MSDGETSREPKTGPSSSTAAATVPAPRTLVIRLPNPAGDVVMATPVLRALRRALPQTTIVWSGKPQGLTLLDGLPDRDAVAPIDARVGRGLFGPWRVGRQWRGLGPDAVLLLKDSLGAGIAARRSKASTRVGYARHGRGFLLTHAVEPPRDERGRRIPEAMLVRFQRVAAVFGAVADGLGPRLAVTAEGEAAAGARLARERLSPPYVVVSPGAAFGPSKIYPPRLLADAVRRVREATGLVPLVLCGPGEERLCQAVAEAIGPPVVSTHADLARWPETKSLIAKAALLVGPDAGPRHVAVALGVPVVTVMGPTDPGWTTGDEALVTVVRKEGLTCLGCHLRVCPIGHPCMETLDPEIVAEACLARIRPAR